MTGNTGASGGQLGPLVVDLDGDLSLSGRDHERLRHPQVGGVILFARNFADRDQLRDLTREIKALRSPELLVAVDQEGGRVQRFRNGFTRLPPAAACGRLHDADPAEGRRLAHDVGLVMAGELIDCGVDLSFAPVLDVLQCDSRVIGDRAFHSDPRTVEVLAAACIDGMEEAGMGSVGKHFPGHGGTGADSHTSLPEDGRSLEALRNCDLLPYRSLAGRLRGVMLAHVRYGQVDPGIPSFSPFWIGEVLRGEIGFGGVVLSDDLTMTGAGSEPLNERCSAALRAGCDLLLICNDRAAVDTLLQVGGEDGMLPDSRAAVSALYARPASANSQALAAAQATVRRSAIDSG